MRFVNNLYMYVDITSNMCRDEIDEVHKGLCIMVNAYTVKPV